MSDRQNQNCTIPNCLHANTNDSRFEQRNCPDCEGSGIEPGTYVAATWQEPSAAEPCGRCNGTGEAEVDGHAMRKL